MTCGNVWTFKLVLIVQRICSYFPYGAKLCINGNHWAQRQAEKAGIGFIPMDNAFAAVDDVPALQAICDSLGEDHIRALLAKWLRILPYPFTDDDTAAGYRYDGEDPAGAAAREVEE